MKHEKLKNLLERYLADECTPKERIRVEQWYRQLDIDSEGLSEAQMEKDIAEIRDRLPAPPVRRMEVWRRMAAAVAVLAVISAGMYFYEYVRSTEKQEIVATPAPDVAPGWDRAILKLADGTEIALDDKPDGEIAQDGEQTIYKNADGELTYQHHGDGKASPLAGKPVFNTLVTPRGGQYYLVLPDGTKVWLNAASTMTYAISKSQNERLVKLEGEAYFEVAKDFSRPFRVESKGQVAEVLGTQFNINSYPDEPDVKTTLVEGSVNVVETTNHGAVMLSPGQQATLGGGSRLSVKSVNVEDVVAWKNGKFSFNQSNLATVMRQLARWYDVEVVFNGEIPDIILSGEIYRNTNASNVLEILSFYKLDCRIETIDGAKRIVIQ